MPIIQGRVVTPEILARVRGLIAGQPTWSQRRLAADGPARYGPPVVLVETFVERARFRGSGYRAAHWICVGPTQGRARQDRERCLHAPVKEVLVYPPRADFRKELAS